MMGRVMVMAGRRRRIHDGGRDEAAIGSRPAPFILAPCIFARGGEGVAILQINSFGVHDRSVCHDMNRPHHDRRSLVIGLPVAIDGLCGS